MAMAMAMALAMAMAMAMAVVEPSRNGCESTRSTLTATGDDVLSIGRRIQRSRRKGFRMPIGAVYVGRPTMWGNPFEHRLWGHAKATILHERWLNGRLGALSLERMGFCPGEIDALDRLRARAMADLHTLAGKDLACWCPTSSRWCHAEALLHLAKMHAEFEKYAA